MRHDLKHVHAGRAARSAADDAPVDVAVDVAAAEDDGRARAGRGAGGEQRGQRRRAGALGELVRVVVIRADRRRDLVVGDLDDVVRRRAR